MVFVKPLLFNPLVFAKIVTCSAPAAPIFYVIVEDDHCRARLAASNHSGVEGWHLWTRMVTMQELHQLKRLRPGEPLRSPSGRYMLHYDNEGVAVITDAGSGEITWRAAKKSSWPWPASTGRCRIS